MGRDLYLMHPCSVLRHIQRPMHSLSSRILLHRNHSLLRNAQSTQEKAHVQIMKILTTLPTFDEAGPYAFSLIIQTEIALQCRQLSWNDTDSNTLEIYLHEAGWHSISLNTINSLCERGSHCFLVNEHHTTTENEI